MFLNRKLQMTSFHPNQMVSFLVPHLLQPIRSTRHSEIWRPLFFVAVLQKQCCFWFLFHLSYCSLASCLVRPGPPSPTEADHLLHALVTPSTGKCINCYFPVSHLCWFLQGHLQPLFPTTPEQVIFNFLESCFIVCVDVRGG